MVVWNAKDQQRMRSWVDAFNLWFPLALANAEQISDGSDMYLVLVNTYGKYTVFYKYLCACLKKMYGHVSHSQNQFLLLLSWLSWLTVALLLFLLFLLFLQFLLFLCLFLLSLLCLWLPLSLLVLITFCKPSCSITLSRQFDVKSSAPPPISLGDCCLAQLVIRCPSQFASSVRHWRQNAAESCQEVCNDHLCPVDCRLGDWSGFTSCSEAGSVRMEMRSLFKASEEVWLTQLLRSLDVTRLEDGILSGNFHLIFDNFLLGPQQWLKRRCSASSTPRCICQTCGGGAATRSRSIVTWGAQWPIMAHHGPSIPPDWRV